MIRFQFRCPPPSQTPRSGAVILDLHDVKASVGGSLEKRPAADLHSSSPPLASPASDFPRKNAPLTAECRRLVIATSLLGQEMANIVLSLGSLSEDEDTAYPIPCDTTSSSSVSTSSAHFFPLQILINRSAPPTRPSSSSSVVGTITVTIDSPSAHVDLPKSLLEGLQLWADDVSQLAEQTFSTIAWDIETKGESRFTSLMRSLFFAKSRCYGGKNGENGIGGTHPKARVETVLSIALSEGMATRWG
jgi:autophagy-related protein 2